MTSLFFDCCYFACLQQTSIMSETVDQMRREETEVKQRESETRSIQRKCDEIATQR